MQRSLAIIAVSTFTTIASAQQTQTVQRTVYKTVNEEVQQYNPATGRYETRTVQKTVAVPVLEEVPVAPQAANKFMVEFYNHYDFPIKLSLSQDSVTLQPKHRVEALAHEGEMYTYHTPPTRAGNGRMLGGVGMHGKVSAQQRTIHLGQQTQPQPQPRKPLQPMGPVPFKVTMVNGFNAPVSISIFDRNGTQLGSRTLQAREQINVTAKPGYTYVQSGPRVFNINGTSKSATYRGDLTPQKPVVYLKG